MATLMTFVFQYHKTWQSLRLIIKTVLLTPLCLRAIISINLLSYTVNTHSLYVTSPTRDGRTSNKIYIYMYIKFILITDVWLWWGCMAWIFVSLRKEVILYNSRSVLVGTLQWVRVKANGGATWRYLRLGAASTRQNKFENILLARWWPFLFRWGYVVWIDP
jgi:hypothetical protein